MKFCRVSVASTILEEDPLLTGFDNSKIVFTDITYGVEGKLYSWGFKIMFQCYLPM